MRYFRMIYRTVIVVLVGSLLHYVLPQHDVARITSTEVIRTDFTSFNRFFYAQADSGSAELTTRDLRLINTERQKTWFLGFFPRDSVGVMVFRNEDSGWIWPPYFKFDSSDLQAEAASKISTTEERWVVVTHYGWRNRFFSIYPNAVGIRDIAGPDVRIVPWFNIFFFIFLFIAYFVVRGMWRQFRERTLDPLTNKASSQMDEVNAGIAKRRSGLSRWLGTWRSK